MRAAGRAVAGLQLVGLVTAAVMLAVLELLYLPAYVGAWPAPVSVLVAGLTTPWLVHLAASVSRRPLVVGAPLVAWLVTVFVVGTMGPGGDVLLPVNPRSLWRSLLLLIAGVIPAAVVLGWASNPPSPSRPAGLPTQEEQHG
jgi:hypothetical protein